MPYYHVHVIHHDPSRKGRKNAYDLDLSKEELMGRIVEPYFAGKTFLCGGQPIDAFFVDVIRVSESEETSSELIPKLRAERARKPSLSGIVVPVSDNYLVVENSRNVTRKFVTRPPQKEEISEKQEKPKRPLSKNVFIVHGREDKPKLELARMLEKLGFSVMILSEQPDKGRTIIEKLEQETLDIGYAFVILTPDDMGFQELIVELSKQYPLVSEIVKRRPLISRVLKPRARQNVILELGYFVGKIGRNRVCCLYKGEVELPSDIHGVLFKKFNKSVEECYKGIIDELKAVGYEIKV